MAECKPQKCKPRKGHHGLSNHRESGNHAKMQTMGGWKPQQSVNHESANHGRDTMSNHRKMQTTGGCKPQSNHTGWKPRKGGNHRGVETTETYNSGYRYNIKRKRVKKMKVK